MVADDTKNYFNKNIFNIKLNKYFVNVLGDVEEKLDFGVSRQISDGWRISKPQMRSLSERNSGVNAEI